MFGDIINYSCYKEKQGKKTLKLSEEIMIKQIHNVVCTRTACSGKKYFFAFFRYFKHWVGTSKFAM
jgi:hypothetical protein